ncbi:MAG: hypothetical protein DMG67_01405 [Acidobacteria bacterium]|nr:MAG: hypothetical protein DMG67_01405 [Acidobacteriota bacterium]
MIVPQGSVSLGGTPNMHEIISAPSTVSMSPWRVLSPSLKRQYFMLDQKLNCNLSGYRSVTDCDNAYG